MAMLRMLNRDLHSNYGPTADTGGLMQSNAPVIYAYPDMEALLEGEVCATRLTTTQARERLVSKNCTSASHHASSLACKASTQDAPAHG